MSEVLLKQLQQVLAPWESLPDKDKLAEGCGEASSLWPMSPPTAPSRASSTSSAALPFVPTTKHASVGWPLEEAATAYIAHSRTATTKLELTRAALALFSSNAGVYRPFLVKLLRFLFDHVDELREEQGRLRVEWWVRQQNSGSSTTKGENADGGGGGLVGATLEEQNAVAAAYEKVRMIEARMAALVEEAAVQRDHFRSQMLMQKRHQHHLEDLICHQVELTQTLLDNRLHQDLVSGKQSTAVTTVSAVTQTLQGSRGVAHAGLCGGDDYSRGTREGSNSPSTDAFTTRDILGLECNHLSLRPPERRDAVYVQRLISRAEKELLLERTEDQLRDLRVQYERLQNKVQSLLKLNTRYARQSVELSARLSILHEHNIALAADVQLFQRDYVRELQRAERLQRDLQVARGMALTMLHVQFGRQLGAGEEESESKNEASKGENTALWQAGTIPSRLPAPEKDGEGRIYYSFEKPELLAPETATVATGAGETVRVPTGEGTRSKEEQAMLVRENHMRDSLHVAQGKGLHSQLQELLAVSDPQHSKIKASLLQNLHLRGDTSLQRSCDERGDFLLSSFWPQGWLSKASVPQWAPPYGVRHDVPLQLRSRSSVPLLHLHPVVAEVFVHELLSQRQELLWYSKQQSEARQEPPRTAAGSALDKRDSYKVSTPSATTMFMSFPEYIGLFVLVVWLNKPNYFTYLLPPSTPLTVAEDAPVREDLRNEVMRKGAAPSDTSTDTGGAPQSHNPGVAPTSLWDLRHILYTIHLADNMEQLPAEGLHLTYALDTASRQLTAGPLTYAYGLASRGSLCDVLFDLLRAERFVFVELCRAVEVDILAKQQEEHERWVEARRQERQTHVTRSGSPKLCASDPASAGPPSPKRDPPSSTPLRGCIPVVQVARVLLAMYPGYSATTMDQLIRAAVTDATNVAENPAYLFYEVLLPSRMLPGPTTASMSIDPSMAVGTSFASLFYTAICDDALESMQLVEDSVHGFAYGHLQSNGISALPSTSAATVISGASTATAQQLTSLAFLGVSRMEAQYWGPSLRSAIYRWPRLRSTVLEGPPVTSPVCAGDAVLDGDAATTREARGDMDDEVSALGAAPGTDDCLSPDSGVIPPAVTSSVHPTQNIHSAEDTKAAAEVSSVARVSVEEVVPYLRRHLLLRRGLYDWTAGTSAPDDISLPPTKEGGQAARKTLKAAVAKAARAVSITRMEEEHHWSAAHSDLLWYWDSQWAEYSGKTASSFSAYVGPTEPSMFKHMLNRVDPHRTCAWSSELLRHENPLMHPVTYLWTQCDPLHVESRTREEGDSSSSHQSGKGRKPKKDRRRSVAKR